MPRVETPEQRAKRLARLKITSRAWYLRNRERHLANTKRYASANKDHRLQVSYVWRKKNPDKIDRIQQKYRDSHRADCRKRCKDWYAKNKSSVAARKKGYFSKASPEQQSRIRAGRSKYFKDHPEVSQVETQKRRALKRGASVRPERIKDWWTSVKSKPTAVCYYCSKSCSTEHIHMDHVIPLARGGAHSIENLCVSCANCNCSKGAKLPSDFWKPAQVFLNL